MKKIILVLVCVCALMACGSDKRKEDLRASIVQDSLNRILSQKDAELNDIMGTINDIQEGFREINLAEGRVSDNAVNAERMTKEDIRENISFIQRTMQLNRERIARLQAQMKNSTVKADKLEATILELQRQMTEKQTQIEALQAQLKEKDIKIEEQGKEITKLNTDVSSLAADNEAKKATISKNEETIGRQDKDLHTAYYVFGTKKELKSQGILDGSDVLKGNYNKNYMTKIDTRVVKSIKLYSKSATLKTSHPAGSYTLESDAQKQYTLYIKNPDAFWSISKSLVVVVK